MLKFVSAILLLTLSIATKAQLSLGVSGGGNLSSMFVENGDTTFSKNYTQRLGANIGPILSYKLDKTFSFRTGAIYKTRGFTINENLKVQQDRYSKTRYSVITHYIDVPLTAIISLMPDARRGIFIELGYYIGIAIDGKRTKEFGEDKGSSSEISFGDSNTNEIGRRDQGFTFGTGVKFKKIEVGVFGDIGMTNITLGGDNDLITKNRVFRVSVAFSSF